MNSGHLMFFGSSSTRERSGQMIMLGGRNTVYRGTGQMLALSEDGRKRRPFFTGPDEYFEEEYYDEQLPEKKRRLTAEQLHLLEKNFEEENKLEPERKIELARNLGLQPRQVAVWFQNRRARWKNKQIESDYDRLKASYDSLLVNHESLLKDNDRLRSQVLLLTEKFQEKEQAGLGMTEVMVNDQVGSSADLTALNIPQKSEERQSSGSGGSAVVDEKRAQNLVDRNGESYFSGSYNCLGPFNGGVQSEEDDVSNEGCSYYTEQFFGKSHQPELDAQLGWWVWS